MFVVERAKCLRLFVRMELQIVVVVIFATFAVCCVRFFPVQMLLLTPDYITNGDQYIFICYVFSSNFERLKFNTLNIRLLTNQHLMVDLDEVIHIFEMNK